jgi:crotonobetaine/carnitine-CoA ligase
MTIYSMPDRAELYPNIVVRLATSNPDRTFAHFVEGGSLTWQQLHQEALAWARRFLALGMTKGAMVASLAENGPISLCQWTGLTYIGGVEVPICHEFRGRMLAKAINNSGARLLLVTKQFWHLVESVADELHQVSKVVVVDGAPPGQGDYSFELCGVDDVPTEAVGDPDIDPQWHDLACVIYTSGTTGASKPVQLPWAQAHALSLGTYPVEDLSRDDVIYYFSPSYHMGPKIVSYLAAVLEATVVLRERFSATEFWEDVARYGATTSAIVGPMMQTLMDNPDGPGRETSLRNVFTAPVIPQWQEFNQRFGTRICTCYNSTEMGIPIRSAGWNSPDHQSCGRIREGYPGYEVRLVDANDNEVADAAAGEVIVRSQMPWTLNAGYLNMSEATVAAWRNGWFHTGDIMRRNAEGDYFLVDRLKDAIRRRGENISSFEVEADVLEHPDVQECAAVAAPAETGEDEILLFVVPRPASDLTPKRLVQDLIPSMARFMVPRYVEFVVTLPRTEATHRVQKAELRKRGVGAATWDRVKAGIEIPRSKL